MAPSIVEEEARSTSPFAYDVKASDEGNHAEPVALRSGSRTNTKVNRRINTCQPCQAAKRACDRQRPCKACTERKQTDKCKYASDATEPVDTRWLQRKLMMQDNLIIALYNSLGVSKDKRESIAQSQMDATELRVDLPAVSSRRPALHHSLPPTHKVPSSHFTAFSMAPENPNIDLATLVFGSSSVFVGLDDLLGPWSETLGLRFRAFPVRDPRLVDPDKADNINVNMIVAHSELDPGPVNPRSLNTIRFAFEVFVAPAGSSGSYVTPTVVARLPPQPLREMLWNEFESMMVLHNGLITPELKKRMENMFTWAEWSSRSDMETSGNSRPPPPTLSFFSVVCCAFAIGAQSRECKAAHRSARERLGDSIEHSEFSGSSTPAAEASTSSHWTEDAPTPGFEAQDFHELAEAARMVIDQSDFPPNLDYIVSHMFSWLYLLHPSNSHSCVSDCQNSISGGGPNGIDPRIWKELGKVVNVARAMGLGIDPDTTMVGDQVHGMSLWEKEMRRRVWWELCWFDAYMSECVGQSPLIDETLYDCKTPVDVDISVFSPTSNTYPPPNGNSTSRNLSHFVHKCLLVKLIKEFRRLSTTPDQLEHSIVSADSYEREIKAWKTALPPHLTIKGLPTTQGDDWQGADEVVYPSTDIMLLQSCHLYTMANALILRLWAPFLFPTLERAHQHNRWPADATTAAAHAIVVAMDHIRTQLRDIRPANLGYFFFGRSNFVAGCMASTVAIRGSPQLHHIETAVDIVAQANEISRDPTICGIGRPDPKLKRFEVGRVLELLHKKAENCMKINQAVVGTKRKDIEGPLREPLKLRKDFELPYLGKGVVTTTCTLRLNSDSYRNPQYTDDGDPTDPQGMTTRAAETGEESRSPPSTKPPPQGSWSKATRASTRPSESEDDRRIKPRPSQMSKSRSVDAFGKDKEWSKARKKNSMESTSQAPKAPPLSRSAGAGQVLSSTVNWSEQDFSGPVASSSTQRDGEPNYGQYSSSDTDGASYMSVPRSTGTAPQPVVAGPFYPPGIGPPSQPAIPTSSPDYGPPFAPTQPHMQFPIHQPNGGQKYPVIQETPPIIDTSGFGTSRSWAFDNPVPSSTQPAYVGYPAAGPQEGNEIVPYGAYVPEGSYQKDGPSPLGHPQHPHPQPQQPSMVPPQTPMDTRFETTNWQYNNSNSEGEYSQGYNQSQWDPSSGH